MTHLSNQLANHKQNWRSAGDWNLHKGDSIGRKLSMQITDVLDRSMTQASPECTQGITIPSQGINMARCGTTQVPAIPDSASVKTALRVQNPERDKVYVKGTEPQKE